jgi:UDP-glucose 4-epimerase
LRETSKVGKTTNPYGTSKYMIERILMDIAKEDPKWRIRIARYFNPVGNHSSGSIRENSKGPPNNLFPYIMSFMILFWAVVQSLRREEDVYRR